MPDWKERTWADQTFIQAAYGFRKNGAIVLTMEDVRNDMILQPLLYGTRQETPQGAYPEPAWALPGADTRIRMHLQEHTRWKWMNPQNDTVAWIGPDGSIILTSPEGWGMPDLAWREPAKYHEFGEKKKSALGNLTRANSRGGPHRPRRCQGTACSPWERNGRSTR